MTRVNKICMSALMLGAAAIVAPVMAQDAQNNANPAENAQPAAAPNENAPAAAENAPAASQNAQAAAEASPPAAQPMSEPAKEQAADNAQAGTRVAMNTEARGHDVAEKANIQALGDTSRKYSRHTRKRDFHEEAKITQQLNQKVADAVRETNTQTAMNQ